MFLECGLSFDMISVLYPHGAEFHLECHYIMGLEVRIVDDKIRLVYGKVTTTGDSRNPSGKWEWDGRINLNIKYTKQLRNVL